MMVILKTDTVNIHAPCSDVLITFIFLSSDRVHLTMK
jgi:hypothetical protein